jgi:hypothetical protein
LKPAFYGHLKHPTAFGLHFASFIHFEISQNAKDFKEEEGLEGHDR